MEFSDQELEFLLDKDFLLTKRKISERIFKMLSALEVDLKTTALATSFPYPKGTLLKSGKISKGDNYKGLPYFILDYPRLFTRRSVFAYRSMIWWGHHFSTTLHMGGEAKEYFAQKLLANFDALTTQDFFVCVNIDPWHYHFERDNYKHISDVDRPEMEKIIANHDFLKISCKVSLQDYKQMHEFSINNMKRFFSYLLT